VTDRLTGTFRKPFREALAAFRLRLGNLVPTARWDDLWQEQHDRAFMVAGATKADLLADLAAAVDKAIARGTSLEEFRRDFRRIVDERGWHGWTGEGTKAGEAWRTRVIYRTNMRTAYSAGRMAQLIEGGFPLWVYRHGGSAEPRIIHLGWDGLVLPSDHPFWATHAPPNGWGCSCYIVGARSLKGAQRLGGQPGKPLPDGWQKLDAKTGTPAGIDRGWAYAPGGSAVDDIRMLTAKLGALPPELSVAVIQDWVRSALFARWFAEPVGAWPVGRIGAADAAALESTERVAKLSADSARKQAQRHPELSAAEYLRIQEVIDTATEKLSDGPRKMVFVKDAGDAGGYVLVVKAVVENGELFLVSFYRLSRDAARRDRTLQALRRKNGAGDALPE
jgi:hypothetical protein